MKLRYAGSDWLVASQKVAKISPLGIKVADLLGEVYKGLYHIPTSLLRKVHWEDEDFISVSVMDGLSSWDDDKLTKLIVLGHDMMIRVEIVSCCPNYLKLLMSKRDERDGSIMTGYPTMEEHIKMIRGE